MVFMMSLRIARSRSVCSRPGFNVQQAGATCSARPSRPSFAARPSIRRRNSDPEDLREIIGRYHVRCAGLHGRRRLQRRDRPQQPPPIADQGDAAVFQILGRQAREQVSSNLVFAQCRRVVLKPQLPQPFRNVRYRSAGPSWLQD
jgi:hypothetical protein